MSLLLKLDGQPRVAFYQLKSVLAYLEPAYQAFSGLLDVGDLRRILTQGGAAELPHIEVNLDNGQGQLTSWFRENPPFRARGELSELRGSRLTPLFVGSVMVISLGSTIKLTLES